MTQELWTAVDDYIGQTLIPPDPVLEAALSASVNAGLPQIQVAANQGRLLNLLAQLTKAERILEVGTLGGYSSIWMARALPAAGQLITLEIDEAHARVAEANFERAGLSDRIRLIRGAALGSLEELRAEKAAPFDLVFIDADKENILEYFQHSLELTRSGSLIVIDNVIRSGGVIDANSADAMVRGVRRFNKYLQGEARVDATTIQMVGVKGYDGMTFALVK